MAKAKPEQAAQELLHKYQIQAPPIPVDEIARKLKATLLFEPFEGKDDVSAMLFRDGTRIVIGVNSTHPRTRQRFSIAHECGHLLLHKGEMFIDARVNFRDGVSKMAVDQEEIEANAFAAAFLMPRDMIMAEIKKTIEKVGAKSFALVVAQLALKFDVSEKAMEYRLKNLGLVME